MILLPYLVAFIGSICAVCVTSPMADHGPRHHMDHLLPYSEKMLRTLFASALLSAIATYYVKNYEEHFAAINWLDLFLSATGFFCSIDICRYTLARLFYRPFTIVLKGCWDLGERVAPHLASYISKSRWRFCKSGPAGVECCTLLTCFVAARFEQEELSPVLPLHVDAVTRMSGVFSDGWFLTRTRLSSLQSHPPDYALIQSEKNAGSRGEGMARWGPMSRGQNLLVGLIGIK